MNDKDLDILKEDNLINSLSEGSSNSQEGNSSAAAAPVIKYPFGTERNLFDTNCDKLLLWMCFTPSKTLKKIHWSKITPKEIGTELLFLANTIFLFSFLFVLHLGK